MAFDDLLRPALTERLPDAAQVMGLSAPEMLLLWAVRSWVWDTVANGQDDTSRMDQGLARAGCPDAAAPLRNFLLIVGSAAKDRVQIHRPCCTNLGDDEKRLLYALAAEQSGRSLDVFEVLGHLLPASAVRIALESARAAAQGFARAGLFLSVRAWNLPELSVTHRLRAPLASTRDIRNMIH